MMMIYKKTTLAVLPILIILCHALEASANLLPAAADSVTRHALADSIRREARKDVSLKEVIVTDKYAAKDMQMASALNVSSASQQFIRENFSGSLMQTLSRLPGVQAMSIGSGESKPVIRGLGFNRVLVAENGVKHEGQQWGDDHGLEVDQFAVEHAEVIKGPASLAYGSDAIGGVINLRSNSLPINPFSGSVQLFARSNNESIGSSVRLTGRQGRFWYKANATWVDYADYRVPTDSIEYYSYYIKLKKQRLRNTAGREMDASLMLGYAGERWRTSLRITDVDTKAGFFANAHGLEVRLSDIDYDHSRRDIDLPYHRTNHLALTSHSSRSWTGGMLEVILAYQNNRQREFAEPVSHGYMPIPPGTLERSFDKHTLTASLRARHEIGKHQLQGGINLEHQRNRRGGWGFILPRFEQLTLGGFVMDRWSLSDRLALTAGVRYDHGSVRIHSYHDWYKTPVDGDSVYVERSAHICRDFNSLTWSVGLNQMVGNWVFKVNVGKSFRMPIAKELGTDGVNYSIFRYEKGNSGLSPEESYQTDAGIVYEHGAWTLQLTPYLNYFPNYIYLNPTPLYVEGLQLYHYTQARVMRWGFEANALWQILSYLRMEVGGEYLYARQLSGEKKGYGLPFSTPWSARAELRYLFHASSPAKAGHVAIEWRIVGSQKQVVPPEEITNGHQLLNASVGKSMRVGKGTLELTLRGENLLGIRYYDHTSYYRLIGVPEPGRNFSLMAAWNF